MGITYVVVEVDLCAGIVPTCWGVGCAGDVLRISGSLGMRWDNGCEGGEEGGNEGAHDCRISSLMDLGDG